MRSPALATLSVLLLVACGDDAPPAAPPGAPTTPPTPAAPPGPSLLLERFRPEEWQRKAAARFAEVEGVGGRLRPVRVPGRPGLFEDFHVEGRIADAEVPALLGALHDDVAQLLRDTDAQLDGGFRPVGPDFDPALADALLRAPVPPQDGFAVRYRVGDRAGEIVVIAARSAADRWNLAVAAHEDAGR